MKYAVIENGKVVNTVEAEPEFALNQGWIQCSEEAGIGWDYDGTSFTDNRPEDVVPAEPTKEELMQQLQVLSERIQSLT